MPNILRRAEEAWPEYRDTHPANNTPEQRHAFIAGYCAREREIRREHPEEGTE